MKFNQQRVGGVFPMKLGEPFSSEKDPDNLVLRKIYLLISKYVAEDFWTVQDFKKFRCSLAKLRKTDFFEYQNLVKNLLIDIQNIPTLIKELNQVLDLHLFDVRKKIVETDPETGKIIREYYQVTERSYEPGDIVLVGQKILEKIDTIIFRNCNFFAQSFHQSTEQIFNSYEQLLYGEDDELLQRLIEKIIDEFDETFSQITNFEVLAFLMVQRSKLPEKISDALKQYYQDSSVAYEKEKTKVFRHYVVSQMNERHAIMAKRQKENKNKRYH